MTWTVRYRDEEAFARLERIPEPDRRRIAAKIERLAQDPFPPGCKKLHMQPTHYRIRSGNFRVIYTINTAEHLVVITRVRDRKNAYRGL